MVSRESREQSYILFDITTLPSHPTTLSSFPFADLQYTPPWDYTINNLHMVGLEATRMSNLEAGLAVDKEFSRDNKSQASSSVGALTCPQVGVECGRRDGRAWR